MYKYNTTDLDLQIASKHTVDDIYYYEDVGICDAVYEGRPPWKVESYLITPALTAGRGHVIFTIATPGSGLCRDVECSAVND